MSHLPAGFAGLTDAHRWISSFEFARTFTWEIENHWSEISETLRSGRLADGLSCNFERYVEMCELAARCRARMDAVFADYDVLLTPAAFGEAPRRLERVRRRAALHDVDRAARAGAVAAGADGSERPAGGRAAVSRDATTTAGCSRMRAGPGDGLPEQDRRRRDSR